MVCQQTRPEQTTAADALTGEKAKTPAPIIAPKAAFLTNVMFNISYVYCRGKLTTRIDLSSAPPQQSDRHQLTAQPRAITDDY